MEIYALIFASAFSGCFTAMHLYFAFSFRKKTGLVGRKCIVFDSNKWFKEGDVGKNKKFYNKAEILTVRTYDDSIIVDVVFLKDGRISNGHYLDTIKIL